MSDSDTIAAIVQEELAAAQERIRERIAQLGDLVQPTKSNGIDHVEQLHQFCRDQGIVVFPGDVVSESDAARLLHRSRRTLQNWRKSEQLPRLHHMGRRVLALEHIARLLKGGPRGAYSWPIPGLDDDDEPSR